MKEDNWKEKLYYDVAIQTVDKLIVYGNVERSKNEAFKIALNYTSEIFDAIDEAYLNHLKKDNLEKKTP